MKIRLVLADTGRLFGSAVSLLNAGWTTTTAAPLATGGWTLPNQALAIFLEAGPDELSRPYTLKLELVDDEGKLVQFANPGVPREVRIVYPVIVQPVPGAPAGTPGNASVLLDLAGGTLRIPSPRRRYMWHVTVEEDNQSGDDIGFWVNAPLQQPMIGHFNTVPS